MRGNNCTVAAYGASGSGKTRMILGDSFHDNLMENDQDCPVLKESHRTPKHINQKIAIPATTPKRSRMN